MSRRILLTLLSLIILSTMTVTASHASDAAVLEVGHVSAMPGDTVTVPIALSANPGIAGLSIQIGYDSARLQVSGIEAVAPGAALGRLTYVGINEHTYSRNPFTVTWFGASNDTSTGVLLNVTFTVRTSAQSGMGAVTVSNRLNSSFNQNGDAVALTITQGGVTITRDSTSGGGSQGSGTSGNGSSGGGSSTGGQTQPNEPDTGSNDENKTAADFTATAETEFIDKSTLSEEFQELASDNSVFTILGEEDGQKAAVAVQYTLRSTERAETVVVYRIDKESGTEIVRTCRYDTGTSAILLRGETGGLYMIGTNEVTFADIAAGTWYNPAISFVSARELFDGIGNNRYGPRNTMTRAMFVTVLARLDGADVTGYDTSPFADTDIERWSGPSIAWAEDTGIIDAGILNGYETGEFGPNDPITREQMAALIANYISKTDLKLPAATVEAFSDIDQASEWSRSAIDLMRAYAIISGIGNNRYNPTGTATRADVAQIFTNLINVMIR